jgi:hypothetical protein
MNIVIAGLKATTLYLIKKYAAQIVFDLIVQALERAASKTDNKIDDDLVATLKSERTTVLTFMKG